MSSRTHGQGVKDFELPLLCFPREDLRLEICGFESSFVLTRAVFPDHPNAASLMLQAPHVVVTLKHKITFVATSKLSFCNCYEL